jgi:methyltransferase (TIGR00027 family)
MSHSKAMAWAITLRTTGIDRLVMDATTERQADTVLNLGAGLDTRPYRLRVPATLRWFEVDLPKIIDLKNTRLRDAAPRCLLMRTALDLTDRENRQRFLTEALADCQKALVLTEGLLPYLGQRRVEELSADLLAQPKVQYWIQDYYNGSHTGFRNRMARKLKSAPIIFTPQDWLGFFECRGWRVAKRITAFEEVRRIRRPLPFMFPWSLLLPLLRLAPEHKRQKMREMYGYVMWERA